MGLKAIISSVANGKTSATDNLEKLKIGGVSSSDAKFPKTPGDIKLGMMVQDSLTGCFGTASSRHDMSSGNIQFGVQPVGDGANYPEAWSFDWKQLLVLGDHLSGRAVKPANAKFALGDRAKDKISGFEGIITEISTYFNGCVFAGLVSSKLSEIDGKPSSQTLASHRIEVIEPAEKAKVLDIPKAVKTGDDKALAKGTGGPARRVERVR